MAFSIKSTNRIARNKTLGNMKPVQRTAQRQMHRADLSINNAVGKMGKIAELPRSGRHGY